jgi:hypothetical protein
MFHHRVLLLALSQVNLPRRDQSPMREGLLHKVGFHLHLPPLRAALCYPRVDVLAISLVLSRLGSLGDYWRDFGVRHRVVIALCIKNASRSDIDVVIALPLADAGPRRLPL